MHNRHRGHCVRDNSTIDNPRCEPPIIPERFHNPYERTRFSDSHDAQWLSGRPEADESFPGFQKCRQSTVEPRNGE